MLSISISLSLKAKQKKEKAREEGERERAIDRVSGGGREKRRERIGEVGIDSRVEDRRCR